MKIQAEQKATGKSSSSVRRRSREKMPKDDVKLQFGKYRRTEKMVAASTDKSEIGSKKRKHQIDELTLEPQAETEKRVAGENDGSGTRSRKRHKGSTHEENGSAAPGSVFDSGLVVGGLDRGQVSSQYRFSTTPAFQAYILRNCSTGIP